MFPACVPEAAFTPPLPASSVRPEQEPDVAFGTTFDVACLGLTDDDDPVSDVQPDTGALTGVGPEPVDAGRPGEWWTVFVQDTAAEAAPAGSSSLPEDMSLDAWHTGNAGAVRGDITTGHSAVPASSVVPDATPTPPARLTTGPDAGAARAAVHHGVTAGDYTGTDPAAASVAAAPAAWSAPGAPQGEPESRVEPAVTPDVTPPVQAGRAGADERRAIPGATPSDAAGDRPAAASPAIADAQAAAGPDAGGADGSSPREAPEDRSRPPDVPVRTRVSGLALVTGPDGTLHVAAGPVSTTSAPSLTPEERVDTISRLIQAMRVQVRQGVSEATVRLHPAHLGEVSIRLRVDGSAVSAVVHAESAGVREWLQSQEMALRQGLSEHGLQLERLHVQRDRPHDHREPPPEPPARPRRRSPDGEPRFEVTA